MYGILISDCNNGYTNAPQRYILRTLIFMSNMEFLLLHCKRDKNFLVVSFDIRTAVWQRIPVFRVLPHCCIRLRPSWRGYLRCDCQLDRAGVRCSVKTGNVCEARGKWCNPFDPLGRVSIAEAGVEKTGCCNLRLWNAISPWLVSLYWSARRLDQKWLLTRRSALQVPTQILVQQGLTTIQSLTYRTFTSVWGCLSAWIS